MKQAPLTLSRDTPDISASLFRAQVHPHLIQQQGEWLDWRHGAYVAVEDKTIRASIAAWMRGAQRKAVVKNKLTLAPFDPKPGDISAVREMLETQTHRPREVFLPPCWLGESELDPKTLISVQNGLLDIATCQLYEPTPLFFTRTMIPVAFDPKAPKPVQFLEFLNKTMQGNAALIDILQMMFGYILSPDTSLQKVFFFFGKSRAGKGTLIRVLEKLVGEEHNVTAQTIETLAGRFGLENMVGKTLAIITDMNCEHKPTLGTAASRINAISGEDAVDAERKGIGQHWHGRLGARIVMAGNTLPDFRSHTDAMMARLRCVPFDVSFIGREDRDLTDKLLAELPGILLWALDGLDTLRLVGDFEEPQESKELKVRMRAMADPVQSFVNEYCTLEADSAVDKQLLYAEYVTFCEKIKTAALAHNTFTEKMRELCPGVRPARRTSTAGQVRQPTIYAGIRFNDEIQHRVFAHDENGNILLSADGWPVPRSVRGGEP